MADLFSNSIANFSLYTPPKPFHPLSSLPITTTAGRWRRRRRKPLQSLFFCKPNSQDFQVISTHEHVDGSVIFRFGDPSELAKEVEDELVESKLENLESKDVEEFSLVEVMDGDYEREVIVKTLEREVRNEDLTDADIPNISDSPVSRSEGMILLERGIESDEQLCENSDDGFTPSVHRTGLLDHSESEVRTKNVLPLEEILVENDGGKVSIQLTDNVEAQAGEGDRESSEKSASEVSTTNVVALEDVFIEKSAAEVFTENFVPYEEIFIEKEKEQASVPLTDNVEVQAEQVDSEANDKFSPELSIKNVVPLEETVVENDDREALISLTDNGSTSVEFPADQDNRESSEESASQFSTKNIVTLEEVAMEKNESEDSVPLTDNYGVSLEVQEKQGDRELSEELLEDSVTEVHDSSVSEVIRENAIPMDDKILEEREDEGSDSLRDNDGASAQVQEVESGGDSMIQSISSDVDSSTNVTVNQKTSEEDESSKHFTTGTVEPSSLEDSGENQIVYLSKDDEDQKTQIGIIEDSMEDEAIELSPPTEAEPVLDEEVSHEIQELYDLDRTQTPMSLNNNPPKLILEVEQTEDVESFEPKEASVHGMVEVESTEASPTNNGIYTTDLVLSSGAALLPHPSKALTGGEDAYFVTNQNWLGIADGVGRWSLEGIHPGVYSRELMENCEKVILQCGSDSGDSGDSGTDPTVVLKLSVEKVESPGSSTALIAHFDGQVLHVANVGDSGFMIIRNGVIHKKSSPMLHEFNFPTQIDSSDDPSHIVEVYRTELDEGDILVTGTDGLFNNLYAQEITLIITKSLEANKTPKEIAEILATRAQEAGGSGYGRSPFSDAAQAAGYVGHTGGKLDDVAVIVSLVQKCTG